MSDTKNLQNSAGALDGPESAYVEAHDQLLQAIAVGERSGGMRRTLAIEFARKDAFYRKHVLPRFVQSDGVQTLQETSKRELAGAIMDAYGVETLAAYPSLPQDIERDDFVADAVRTARSVIADRLSQPEEPNNMMRKYGRADDEENA